MDRPTFTGDLYKFLYIYIYIFFLSFFKGVACLGTPIRVSRRAYVSSWDYGLLGFLGVNHLKTDITTKSLLLLMLFVLFP